MIGDELRVTSAITVTSLMDHCPIGSDLGGQSHLARHMLLQQLQAQPGDGPVPGAIPRAQAGAARDGDRDGEDGGDKDTCLRIQKLGPLTLLCCSESIPGGSAWPVMGMGFSCGHAALSANHPQVGIAQPTSPPAPPHSRGLQQAQEQMAGAELTRRSSRLCIFGSASTLC